MTCEFTTFRQSARARIASGVVLAGLCFGIAHAGTATYPGTVPTALGATTPCATSATLVVNVPHTFAVSDLDVRFILEHSWRTDANLSVTSPLGTTVELLTGNYGAGTDNYNVIFDDSAGGVIDVAPNNVNQLITGDGVPVQSEGDNLSDFNTEPANGDWTFTYCDTYTAADSGTISNLSLLFEAGPDLQTSKTVTVYPPAKYAIPGNDVIYTFGIENSGPANADDNSIVIIDTLPTEVEFYNGDMDDGGALTSDPVAFEQAGAGLIFNYATDVAYSSNAVTRPATFAECTYTPTTGYDPNVKHICINPKGEFAAGTPDPTVEISFRAQIK